MGISVSSENKYLFTFPAGGTTLPCFFAAATIRAIASFRRLNVTKEILLDITEDGVITEDEKPDMQKVLGNLEELEAVTQNLRIWVKKNL